MDNKYLELQRSSVIKFQEEFEQFKLYAKVNFGVLLTLGYLAGSVSGLVYLGVLLNSFKVNVFDHIDPTDYVLALLSNGGILIAFLGFFIGSTGWALLSLKREAKLKKSTWYNRFYCRMCAPFYKISQLKALAVIYFMALVLYSVMIGLYDAEDIKVNRASQYNLTMSYPVKLGESTLLQLDDISIIASSNSNLFVFRRAVKQVVIIPHSNVAALVPVDEQSGS